MGVDFDGVFSAWQIGYLNSISPETEIDDFAIISAKIVSKANEFTGDAYDGDGFRNDGHGNTIAEATNLELALVDGQIFSYGTDGVIERYSDTDMFGFQWLGGSLEVLADVPGNLAGRPDHASSLGMNLQLLDSSGDLIAEDLSAGFADVDAELSFAELDPGQYFIAIESGGEYEDLGAYGLSLSGVVDAPLPGDYVRDGIVDALDYAFWRDNFAPDTPTERSDLR